VRTQKSVTKLHILLSLELVQYVNCEAASFLSALE